MVSITSDNFNHIYHALLLHVDKFFEYEVVARKTPMKEILNASFELTKPQNNTISSVTRNVNMDYARAFAEYCKNGGENLEEILKLNPAAFRYVSDKHVKGHQVNYGKRIREQLQRVTRQLIADQGTRRAVIHILDKSDWLIIENSKATMEYPCTETLKFYIRQDRLHMIVNMRSQNLATVLVYDVYNFTNLQLMVAKNLNLKVGSYYHNMGSAHYYKNEEEFVKQILTEYHE
jgi:thymidylate synthase